MSISQEIFRFVTLRKPERLVMSQLNSRLVRDLRPANPNSLLSELMGPGIYDDKLKRANTFIQSREFVAPDDVVIPIYDQTAEFFRATLISGMALADLLTALENEHPILARLLNANPNPDLLEQTAAFVARLWDSLYALVIHGCDQYTSTNYLADALRVIHVLRILWMANYLQMEVWPGSSFDEYEVLIDLEKARVKSIPDPSPGKTERLPSPVEPYNTLEHLANELVHIDEAVSLIQRFQKNSSIEDRTDIEPAGKVLDNRTIQILENHPALMGVDLYRTPVRTLLKEIEQRRQFVAVRFQHAKSVTAKARASILYQDAIEQVLANSGQISVPVPYATPLAGLAASFFVPLSVGAIRPPVVGDLLLVEQELQRYEPGEIYDIENIMQGERKEHSSRLLSRTTQTTTTEVSSEREETESLKTDERFQLSSEAQKAASQTFSASVGVNVSGKFGPVQVGVSANASFSTSKSASDSTSQEYAKTVTEEATQRVRESFKQTSSVTLLTESLKTSLHGFNNEGGSGHVIGIYRWVDKIYSARLMNYGRRMMLELVVPEPAAFFRSLLSQNEAELLDGLLEPVPPSLIDKFSYEEIPPDSNTKGFLSFTDINETNYARLAALYDVTDIEPPPLEQITGAKAIVYPEADTADVVKDHSDEANELSLVWADQTLTIDPDYELTQIGVFAPTGENGKLGYFTSSLKLGMNKDKENLLLVQVGDKSFYYSAIGQGNNTPAKITTNFNELQDVVPPTDKENILEGALQTALPILLIADFEGIVNLEAIYSATLRPEALDRWKARTYAAIVKGYQRKKQAYDQAIQIAKSIVQSETEAQTYQLRDEQYRSIEVTELKRGCIDLLTQGTAAGHTSIVTGEDGSIRIVYDEAEGNLLNNWRSPLANGSVIEMFETSFSWDQLTYQFHPYFWTDNTHWKDLMQVASGDPIFEQFLKAGAARVIVPVEPGYERVVVFFLKTGLIWGGGYLPLFTDPDMLEIYADVEQGVQLEPAEQVGERWEVRLPTNLVMLQEGSSLPEFEIESSEVNGTSEEEPIPDERVPF
jgi:hypothetical protein